MQQTPNVDKFLDVQWSFVVIAKNWFKTQYTVLVLMLKMYNWYHSSDFIFLKCLSEKHSMGFMGHYNILYILE